MNRSNKERFEYKCIECFHRKLIWTGSVMPWWIRRGRIVLFIMLDNHHTRIKETIRFIFIYIWRFVTKKTVRFFVEVRERHSCLIRSSHDGVIITPITQYAISDQGHYQVRYRVRLRPRRTLLKMSSRLAYDARWFQFESISISLIEICFISQYQQNAADEFASSSNQKLMHKDTISLRQVECAVRAGTVLTSLLNSRTVFLHRLFRQGSRLRTQSSLVQPAFKISIEFMQQIEIEFATI